MEFFLLITVTVTVTDINLGDCAVASLTVEHFLNTAHIHTWHLPPVV